MGSDFLYTFSETFLTLSKTEKNIIVNVHRSPCKLTHIPVKILMELVFSRHAFENAHISNFTKIRPTGAEVFHAHERTDRHDEV